MSQIPATAAPDVQQSFREVWAALKRFEGAKNIDLKGRRIINAGIAIDPFDYATLRDVEDAVAGLGAAEADKLSPPAGKEPILLYGTHDDRLDLAVERLEDKTLFYETDRAALYQVQTVSSVTDWYLVMCRPLRTADTLPSDLDTNDAGFTWFDQVLGVEFRWSGGVWNYYRGNMRASFASLPDPALADRGFLFIASDRGDHVYRKGASAFTLLPGVGGPLFGTISPDQKPTLDANDADFLFHATDFDRTYRWTGSAWVDAPGMPMRGQIAYFTDSYLPGTGWALCDGSGVTISTTSGGTAAFTTPDLTTDNRFLRSVATTTGGTGGAATTHTHPVNPPSTTSGDNSVASQVQSGTGITVAGHPHTHDTDIAVFDSGTPSGTAGDDALPPYYNARPYIRL